MKRKAIRIYWMGSCLALLEASVLFILGLEPRFEQILILLFIVAPLPVTLMYVCDRWLITRHTRPIDTVLTAQEAGQAVSH